MSDERKEKHVPAPEGKRQATKAELRQKTEEPGGKARRFGNFLLVLIVVLGIVALAAYRDGTGFDMLRRYLNYGRPSEAGGEAIYDYDASGKNRFAVLGDYLAVLSDTSFRLLDKNGGEAWSEQVNMSAPALSTCGSRAVAYDVGGTALYVADQSGILLKLTANDGEPFIAATLNEDGWLAVTAEKRGCKGCVSVYNSNLTLAFAFESRNRFVLDGCVAGGRLAAVTLGQEGGIFVSNVVLYELTKEEPAADYDITGGLVAAIGQQDGLLAAVSDNCLTYASPSGQVTASYDYTGSFLREYDLAGDGFTALLLNRYRSGSLGRLVTVDTRGRELGSLEIREEVLSISAAGKYLGVLYADRLVIYNQNLQTYATLQGADFVQEVLMRPDGSAILISAESAGLFLP